MIVAKLDSGSLRFSELRRLMPLISQQSLTTQLRELERDGVVRRQVYAEVPARVEYSLSDVGRKISPLMSSLMAWDMNSSSCASPRNPRLLLQRIDRTLETCACRVAMHPE